MEPWIKDAKPLGALNAELCFLLQDDFYFGSDRLTEEERPKFTLSLSLPQIPRLVPSLIRSSELAGREEELSAYYKQIVALAIHHKMPFNSIRHYFWLRFWLWNSEEEVHIDFPWYDSYSEIKRFLDALLSVESGVVYHDADQGWDMEVYAHKEHVYIRESDPDSGEIYACLCVPRSGLILQAREIMARSSTSIAALAASLGQDVWTSYLYDEPTFMRGNANNRNAQQTHIKR